MEMTYCRVVAVIAAVLLSLIFWLAFSAGEKGKKNENQK